jgi:hypothetical protein
MLPYHQTGFVKFVHLEGMYLWLENLDAITKKLAGLLFYVYLCGKSQAHVLSRYLAGAHC